MKFFIVVLLCANILLAGGSGAKQEVTHSNNWLNVWKLDGAYYAIKRNGDLYKFGDISKRVHGILDKRKRRYLLKPKFVFGKVVDISVAIDRVYAIDSRGLLYGWGREVAKRGYVKYPKRVKGRNWKTVESVGSTYGECSPYTIAFKRDNSLWGWGDFRGEFVPYPPGSGPVITTPRSYGNNWSKVAMGCYKVYGLKTDGTLWSWGSGNLYPTRVHSKNIANKLKKQRYKISKFNIKVGDGGGVSHQYNGISNGKLWLMPIAH